MGMYDDITVHVPLPGVELPGVEGRTFQTKSLECTLDNYEIRADGTLWHENYTVVDQSDPDATGIFRFRGMIARVNERWERDTEYTGEIAFHEWDADRQHANRFSMYFVKGQLVSGPHRLE